MPAAAPIVVNDRKATPVAHTFAPRGIQPGSALFVETASVPIGEATLTIRTRISAEKYHARLTMAVPVLVTETINGVSVPKVHRVSMADVNFRFENTSTLQERQDIVGMFANALAASQTVVMKSVCELEGVWGS